MKSGIIIICFSFLCAFLYAESVKKGMTLKDSEKDIVKTSKIVITKEGDKRSYRYEDCIYESVCSEKGTQIVHFEEYQDNKWVKREKKSDCDRTTNGKSCGTNMICGNELCSCPVGWGGKDCSIKLFSTLGGMIKNTFVKDDYLYVTTVFSGVNIYNIENPSNSILAGKINVSGEAQAVFVSSIYAYISGTDGIFYIVDIKNPSKPVEKGKIQAIHAVKIYVSGSYAYLVDGRSNFQIIDVSDSENPLLKGKINTPGEAFDVHVSGNYAYVADGRKGLQIVDVIDPSKPLLKGNFGTPSDARGIFTSGKTVYLASTYLLDCCQGTFCEILCKHSDSVLQIIDVSDPLKPLSKGNVLTPGGAQSVSVSGKYAYVADYNHGLQVIDLENRFIPVLKDIPKHSISFINGNSGTKSQTRHVVLFGNYAYVTNYDLERFYGRWFAQSFVQIVDINNPLKPIVKDLISTVNGPQNVKVSGGYAYVADGKSGLKIINVKNPLNPVLEGFFDLSSHCLRNIHIKEKYAYISKKNKLIVVDMHSSSKPFIETEVDVLGSSLELYHSDKFIYILYQKDEKYGLQIIDISVPSKPITKGKIDIFYNSGRIYVSSRFIHIRFWKANDVDMLQTIDITDHEKPILKELIDIPANAKILFISGAYIYLGMWGDNKYKLHLIDTENSSKPILIDNGKKTLYGETFYISGRYAYHLSDRDQFQVIDIKNPLKPIFKGSISVKSVNPWGSSRKKVYVSGKFAYIKNSRKNLVIVDISDPLNPAIKGVYTGNVKGFDVSGNYLYIAGEEDGLKIINISSLTTK